jgi:WXG100 family type VII secretion target
MEFDPANTARTGVQMQEANEQINTAMRQLLAKLAHLPSVWQGPAANDFQQCQASWENCAKQHNDKLQLTAEALSGTAKNQERLETANLESTHRARSAIDAGLDPR